MMGSCVSRVISQSSLGIRACFFVLYEVLTDLQLTVWPQYSYRSRIPSTVVFLHMTDGLSIFRYRKQS